MPDFDIVPEFWPSKINADGTHSQRILTAAGDNTLPIIFGIDVSGSMGRAADKIKQCVIDTMTLIENTPDITNTCTPLFCVMAVGDLDHDRRPLLITEFGDAATTTAALKRMEYEGGGGQNTHESYTLVWYYAYYHTAFECFRLGDVSTKGLIITLGDEPLNPTLNYKKLSELFVCQTTEQADIKTESLYTIVSQNFDVYHYGVDDPASSWQYYNKRIAQTWGLLLKDNYRPRTLQEDYTNQKLPQDLKTLITDIATHRSDHYVKMEPSCWWKNQNGDGTDGGPIWDEEMAAQLMEKDNED